MRSKVIARVQRAKGGDWEVNSVSPNLRVNDGINWQAQIMGNAWGDVSAVGGSPRQIAISTNSDAPSSGTTNLWDELAADGLSRKTATFSHGADASSFTQTASWQYTGGSVITIGLAALASSLTDVPDQSLDTHFAVTLLSPIAVLDSNDTLEIQWGIFY